MGIYNSCEAPGLRLQLCALKKLQLRLKFRDLSDDELEMGQCAEFWL